jgi:uncharacterized membrane protein
MAKTASFGVMHLGIAFAVSYALTGSVAIAGAITFVEPLVNTVAHYFFDKYWVHPRFVSLRSRVHAHIVSFVSRPSARALP